MLSQSAHFHTENIVNGDIFIDFYVLSRGGYPAVLFRITAKDEPDTYFSHSAVFLSVAAKALSLTAGKVERMFVTLNCVAQSCLW